MQGQEHHGDRRRATRPFRLPPVLMAAGVRRLLVGAALLSFSAACSGDRAPTARGLPTSPTGADSADQLLFGARSMLTYRGVSRGVLTADSAYVLDEGNRFDLRRVQVTFVDTAGVERGGITARAGMYHVPSARLELRGEVVMVSRNGRRTESETLVYDVARDRVVSDSTVPR
jgi:hypothetical protein